MRKDYDLVGSYNKQRFLAISPERSINLFEYVDPQCKRPKTLLPTSGLEQININFEAFGANGGARAQFVFNEFMFIVYGSKIFKIEEAGTALLATLLGTINTTSGYIGVDANTFQVIFVDGTDGWIFDEENGLVQITDPAFPVRPIDVCFIDGFFVVANGETNTFQLSSLNQGLIWGDGTGTISVLAVITDTFTVATASADNFQVGTPVEISGMTGAGVADGTYFVVDVVSPTEIKISTTLGGTPITTNGSADSGDITNNGQLQLGALTSHPGTIVACRTLHRRVFFFSQFFTEVWENAGIGTNLPLRRNNSFLIEYGTPAIGSIDVGFDQMYFLSQDRDGLGSIMQVNGTQAIPVSPRALDFEIAQFAAVGAVDDARGILIKENGLIFYRLNFTEANHTFVFGVSMSDVENLRWHEEEVLNGDRHPAQTHGFFIGKNYYGDFERPILYRVDSNLFTNAGENIRRVRIPKTFAPEGYDRIRVDRFQVDLLQGTVDQLQRDVTTLNLTTENTGFYANTDLLTEAGDNIILDQESVVLEDQPPVVFLSLSKDSGQSYGNKIEAPMGAIGQRSFRTVWRKLGTVPRGQAFAPRIEFFNNAPFVVLGAAFDFEIMPE